MNKKNQMKLKIPLAGFVLFLIVINLVISLDLNINQQVFYINESSLIINLGDYFSQQVVNYILSIEGRANTDVVNNHLEVTEIEGDANISLTAIFSEENATKEFFIYYNQEIFIDDSEDFFEDNQSVENINLTEDSNSLPLEIKEEILENDTSFTQNLEEDINVIDIEDNLTLNLISSEREIHILEGGLTDSFISTWDTTKTGTSNSTSITLPLYNGGVYNFIADWGDGTISTIQAYNSANITHNYASGGVYNVTINGTIIGFRFANGGDKLKIIDISNWGVLNLGTAAGQFFYGCSNLQVSAVDTLNLTGTTDLSNMFRAANSLVAPDFSNWNLSGVTILSAMFYQNTAFNGNVSGWTFSPSGAVMDSMFFGATAFNHSSISTWNTSSVTNMYSMFQGASKFNQPIQSWDVSFVTSVASMFRAANSFNQDLIGWNLSSATNLNTMFYQNTAFNGNVSGWTFRPAGVTMASMFYGATAFNHSSISTWNTSSVTNMDSLFYGASKFNQPIQSWDVSFVTSVASMFRAANSFNQDLIGWNLSSATNLNTMFYQNTAFNGNVSGWTFRPAGVTMASMFYGATAFNHSSISTWNTSSVTNMDSLFYGASKFNQPLGSWNVSAVTTFESMFYGVTLSTNNYDNLLNGWASLPSLKTSVLFHAGSSKYCKGISSRNNVLNGTYLWTITDGGLDSSCDLIPPQINIISPGSLIYSKNLTNFINISSNENLDSCFYSLDSWGNNISLTSLNTTYFYASVNFSEGLNTINIWCNDTESNINNTKYVSFFVDLTFPQISFESPTPDNASGRISEFLINLSLFDINLKNISYVWNTSETTNINFSNFTNVSSLLNGLVLFMNFENRSEYGENLTTVADYSGFGNNGTLVGNAFVNLSGGKYGGGLSLDGAEDYVSTNLNASGYTALSISLWVKQSSTGGNQFAGWIDSSNSYNAGFYLGKDTAAGSIQAYIGTEKLSIDMGYDSDVWTHIGFVYNGTSLRIYKNGVQSGEDTSVPTSIPAHTGIDIASREFNMNGSLDDVMIFNTSLSASEVSQLYYSQINKYYAQEGNITVSYQKQQNSSLNTSTLTLTSTDVNMTNFYLAINQTGLVAGRTYTYFASLTDKAGNINITEIRTMLGNTLPFIYLLVQSPNLTQYDNLDPGLTVSFNANISDTTTNFDSAILQYRNSTATDWTNLSMINQTTKSGVYTLVNTSLVLPNYETNLTYRIWMNDSIGDVNTTSNYTLQSFWDCTWTSTSDLGEIAGYNQNKWIGNITINNTGDSEFATANCSLDFRVTYDLDDGRIYYDGEYIKNLPLSFSLSAKSNQSIEINATYSTVNKEENTIITLEEFRARSSTRYKNTTAVLITNQAGPYLYQKITSSPSSVYLTAGSFLIQAYVRNLMGSIDADANNTAYNVSSNWIISSDFVISDGNETQNYTNITDNNLNYRNINLTFSSLADMTSGIKNFSLSLSGYNISGDLIEDVFGSENITDLISITFLCYSVSDGVCVTDCGYAQDPDCEQEVVTTTTTTSGGGGSGGGGGGGLNAKTEATFELKRGEKQEFIFKIDNKYNVTLENLKILVSGVNSEYLEVEPEEIEKIDPYDYAEIKVRIDAPSYFTLKEYILIFSIDGTIKSDSTKKRTYSEKRYITLRILELSREEASKMVNQSYSWLNELDSVGFNVVKLQELIIELDYLYNQNDFASLKDKSELFKLIYESALKSRDILSSLENKIINSEERGIEVLETKKMVYLAESAFERGDFELALKRLEEAELTYALETKGEFNLLYFIKDNPEKVGLGAFAVLLISGASSVLVKFKLYKRKLRILSEEEALLLELMKVVQKECFENNKMSMEEYRAAMFQYERRLNETIEDKIRIETKLSNLFKFKGKKKALHLEQKRLTELIKKLQDLYLVKGKIETRIYEGMLKSYSSRLSDIEEQIAFFEANEALKKRSFWRRKSL